VSRRNTIFISIGSFLYGIPYISAAIFGSSRVTYDGFAQAWPNMIEETGEYGEMMNGYAKHVVSTTLNEAKWNNSTLIKDNIVEQIAQLKQQPGKDILVLGSCDLVQTLIANDLIDEYSLMVFPIVVRTGKRLFEKTRSMKRYLHL